MIYKHEAFGDTKIYSVCLNTDNKYCTIKVVEKIDNRSKVTSKDICTPQEALAFEKELEAKGWKSTR